MKKITLILGLILLTNSSIYASTTTTYSDGTYAVQDGNTTTFSDGTYAVTNGNTTTYSDGSFAVTSN